MQTLFTSDRMIVKGEIKEYTFTIPSEKNKAIHEETKKTISLEFIFQVNGKITQFAYDFEIGESEETKEISLVNWYEWYPVANLFFAMGYSFGTNPFHQESHIISGWINTCEGVKSGIPSSI